MSRAKALAVVAIPGALVGLAAMDLGASGLWAMVVLASLVAGLTEIGGG